MSLVINVVAARTLGPAGRGNIALLLQLGYLVNMLGLAGVDRAYPVYVPEGRTARSATLDMLRLAGPGGVLVLITVLPLVWSIGAGSSSGPGLTVIAFTLAAIALVAGGAVRSAAAASGITGPFLAGTVAAQVVLLAAGALLAAFRVDDPSIWLLAYALALAVAPGLSWALVCRRRAGKTGTDTAHLARSRHLGLRLLPAGVASMVMLRADRLLLPWLGSYEQLGIYIVVATIAEMVAWPVQAWVDARAAGWHRRHVAGELGISRPVLCVAAYGLVTGAAMVGCGRLVIGPVFGEDYRDATRLLLPLAIGAVAYCVSRVAVGLSVATGRARIALTTDVSAMAVALACYLALIPRWGAYGAAVGSAIAYTTGASLAVIALLASTRRSHQVAANASALPATNDSVGAHGT
ncbi:lipopolysaccharide biosynthesis protein [Micromonospora sp. CNB394]|uniref:lipopolysaccharide biosynthesis protein n=1 Tax=Micromonospora sp. CNB394 TaxID=1169151 RepID=UPI0012DFD61E|nr:polysaccharide biosynthesis C-terminal domain-containing protein [Micromonospora sp. CNB394]